MRRHAASCEATAILSQSHAAARVGSQPRRAAACLTPPAGKRKRAQRVFIISRYRLTVAAARQLTARAVVSPGGVHLCAVAFIVVLRVEYVSGAR